MNISAFRPLHLLTGLVLLSTLQGCLTTPVVNISVLKAPAFDDAVKYKAYTVRPFVGTYGNQLTRDIDTALASTRVAEQALVKTVPYEQYLGRAKGVVVDAIVGGEITNAGWSDQSFTQPSQECAVQGDKKILGMKQCKEFRTVTTYCTKRSANFTVAMRVSDARDQRTVWGKTLGETQEATVCQNELGKALPDGSSLLGTAYSKVLEQIRASLIATEQTLAVKLIEAPDALPAPAQERFKGALAFAKANRMDRACEQFGELYEQNKQSVALTYSMGLCQESRGRLWEAVDFYKTADSLTTQPTPTITEALARVSVHVKDVNKVRGIGPEPVATTASKAPGLKDQTLTTAQKAQVQGEHRIALVIGNAKYRNLAVLRNPANDAQDMEAALKQKGFEVLRVTDGTREQITQAVRSFELKIRDNSTALIFYAGHGVQARGINYLLPVDARIETASDLSTEAIDMDMSILRRLDDRNPRLSIIILDACRNNPFPSSSRGAADQAGLATINAPRGSIVAFATAPGTTAQDGTGRNSPYTKNLLKEMQVPNRKIEDVFKRVRESVLKETGSKQTPWENSALTGDFYFSATP